MLGIRSYSSVVNDTASCSIQLPHTMSATATAMAFGTKLSVTSWIWVTDWNSEIGEADRERGQQQRGGTAWRRG